MRGRERPEVGRGLGHAIARRTPPEAYFIVSAVFHYLGPAFAVLLFARVDVLGVMWFRIAAAAAMFALWRRPWRSFAAGDARERGWIVAWAVVLVAMNSSFYLAIARLPLATVAAIEFVPVILLAALGVRTLRNGLALLLAVAGVVLITELVVAVEPLGLAFAFANATLFAGYIVIAHRVAQRGAGGGIDGLAAAMLVAAILATPVGGPQAAASLVDPVAVLAGIGVGISSSVIPYVTDQLAMARLPRATYALLIALLPATAAVVGAVVLAQLPSLREVIGIGLVVGAVALRREGPQVTRSPPPPPPRSPAPRAGSPSAGPTRRGTRRGPRAELGCVGRSIGIGYARTAPRGAPRAAGCPIQRSFAARTPAPVKNVR